MLPYSESFFRMFFAGLRIPDLALQAGTNQMDDFGRLLRRTMGVVGANSCGQTYSPKNFDLSSIGTSVATHEVIGEAAVSALGDSAVYVAEEVSKFWQSFFGGTEKLADHVVHRANVLDTVVNKNKRAMNDIARMTGCNFAEGYQQIAETPRFVLYQVIPDKGMDAVNKKGKPIIHIAPFILPEYILDLLPGKLSYLRAFANARTPTFFMHLKDIMTESAVQLITEEELLLDLKYFAKTVYEKYGRKLSINGTCQGALPFLHAVCSPILALDEYVDTWIGTVPAYGLYESRRFVRNLSTVASHHKDPRMLTQRLPNGNQVVLGEPIAFNMRWSDLKNENPVSALIRDLKGAEKGPISATQAALGCYLEGVHPVPLELTCMSQLAATVPITAEGVFPGELFGGQVSLQYAVNRGIKFYVAAGAKDTVVELPCALAIFRVPCMKEYVGASSYVAPGGHVALITSFTDPNSKNYIGNVGGPLWYHLQNEAETTD